VALNIAAFFREIQVAENIERFMAQHAVVPSQWIVSGASDLLDWPRLMITLITSGFLHSGWLHLASNLLYLRIFGDNVESRLGHGRFLFLYLMSGVIAAVAQIVVTPRSMIPMVGASGSIAGILGAYLLLFPSGRVLTLIPLGFWWETIEMPAFIFLGLWFLLQWLEGLSTIGQVADVGGVAFWAHIGGFVSGMIGAVIFAPRRGD